jgi:hypothetical protein
MLRNEPPYGPLRLRKVEVERPWSGGDADVRALAADVTASAFSPSHLLLVDAPLADGQGGVLDAVVDAALARRLPSLTFGRCSLSHAAVPALARLLGGSALKLLSLQHTGPEPLLLSGPEGSAALLAAALRANNTLAVLRLINAHVWHDMEAAETLLHALTAHPSVWCVDVTRNRVAAAERARAGASLATLIGANAPALWELYVSACSLGDEGLGPLVDALAANTRLRKLDCSGNGMSDAFALERLQPALLANNSLRKLTLVREDDETDVESPALRQLERLVAQRAAARAAQRAAE